MFYSLDRVVENTNKGILIDNKLVEYNFECPDHCICGHIMDDFEESWDYTEDLKELFTASE